jgi:5'-3' exonuclease
MLNNSSNSNNSSKLNNSLQKAYETLIKEGDSSLLSFYKVFYTGKLTINKVIEYETSNNKSLEIEDLFEQYNNSINNSFNLFEYKPHYLIYDADEIAYLISYICKDETKENVIKESIDKYLYKILNEKKFTHYIAYLKPNMATFRDTLGKAKKYKGNRTGTAPQFYLKWKTVIENYLIAKYHFVKLDVPIESDDAVSITAKMCKQQGINYTIVSKDKDLLQLEGNHLHYDTKNKVWKDLFVSEIGEITLISKDKYLATGYIALMYQCLIGDSSDNIQGLKNYGPKKSYEILKDCKTKHQLLGKVLDTYYKYIGKYWGKQIFKENYSLVKLLDRYNEFSFTPIKNIAI